jgi:lysophospholipase L1-like esterase
MSLKNLIPPWWAWPIAIGGPLALKWILTKPYKSKPRPGRAAAVGDSITAHGGFVAELNRLPGYSWDNHGIVANNTRQMLGRASSWAKPEYSEILISGFLNDLAGGRSLEWTKNNLRQLYQVAKATGARVVAATSTPWGQYSRWTPERQRVQDEINRWILAGADGLLDASVDVFTPLEHPRGSKNLNPTYARRDKLHLNREGQRVMGETIARVAYT